MSRYSCCGVCPYIEQAHIHDLKLKTSRVNPPIELENNNSDILLIFQSPGDVEWKIGRAVQDTTKIGGTAGSRISDSWKRVSKSRTDFDIVNLVRCFPGRKEKRDLKPNMKSICSCTVKLSFDLIKKEYKKIIVFGALAKKSVATLQEVYPKTLFKFATHPNGGIKKKDLDNLW